mmetsp:Transcript_1557/g.3478  ORF Transcript_1557/g.3478 Transcript_1557/m.3478 type:complete len:342 (+) Transcript_1557:372-1397(+)
MTTPIAASASSKNANERRRSPSCSFILTGFGPFRGVPDNPTNTLVRRLAKEIEAPSLSSSLASRSNIDIIETHVLETSAMGVQRELTAIYEHVKKYGRSMEGNAVDGAGGGEEKKMDKTKSVVVVHLGVNYRGTQFQLEQCAYNDATFRVPDERGYQPKGVCVLGNHAHLDVLKNDKERAEYSPSNTIEKSANAKDSTGNENSNLCSVNSEVSAKRKPPAHKFGKCFKTTLDLDEIYNGLKDGNNNNSLIVISKDPGRFVCNYTYCLSLDKCSSIKGDERKYANSDSDHDRTSADVHTLFVHVPPYKIVEEDEQYEFILDILEAIELQMFRRESKVKQMIV